MTNYSEYIHDVKVSLRSIRKSNHYEAGKFICKAQHYTREHLLTLAARYMTDKKYKEGLDALYSVSRITQYFLEMFCQGYPIYIEFTEPGNWEYVLFSLITQDYRLINSINEYWSLLAVHSQWSEFGEWNTVNSDITSLYARVPLHLCYVAKALSLLISKRVNEANEYLTSLPSRPKCTPSIYKHVCMSLEAIASYNKQALSDVIRSFNRSWKHTPIGGCDFVNYYGAGLICLAQYVWNEELDLASPLIPDEIIHAHPPYTEFPLPHEFFEIPPEKDIVKWKKTGIKKQNWLERFIHSLFTLNKPDD